ncbi:MAG: phosphate ABC transporter permease subunit PstC [Thermoprotei archaeon]
MKADELAISIASIVPVAFILLIFGFLVFKAYPSMVYNGIKFFTSYVWNPGDISAEPIVVRGFKVSPGASFGILLFLTGTLITSAVALLLSLPASIFASIALALYLNERIRAVVSSALGLFAGIPSVIYGLWGVVFLEPTLYSRVEPEMRALLGFIPFFSGPIYSGSGILASSLVLALMVFPISTSIIYQSAVSLRDAAVNDALALGATKWEAGKLLRSMMRKQILGGGLLSLGRALGETMAVLMTCGGAINSMPTNFYSPINTMAAALTALLDSAFIDPTGMVLSSLAELGVTLLLISVASSMIGRAILGRVALRGELE